MEKYPAACQSGPGERRTIADVDGVPLEVTSRCGLDLLIRAQSSWTARCLLQAAPTLQREAQGKIHPQHRLFKLPSSSKAGTPWAASAYALASQFSSPMCRPPRFDQCAALCLVPALAAFSGHQSAPPCLLLPRIQPYARSFVGAFCFQYIHFP